MTTPDPLATRIVTILDCAVIPRMMNRHDYAEIVRWRQDLVEGLRKIAQASDPNPSDRIPELEEQWRLSTADCAVLTAALERLEWAGPVAYLPDGPVQVCPACNQTQSMGHEDDCFLVAALAHDAGKQLAQGLAELPDFVQGWLGEWGGISTEARSIDTLPDEITLYLNRLGTPPK